MPPPLNDPKGDPQGLPGSAPTPTPAQLQAQAGQAARTALAQVLRDRLKLVAQSDADLARLIDDAIGRIVAELSAQPSDYQAWSLPRLMAGVQRIVDELVASAGASAASSVRQAWDLGEKSVSAPIDAAAAIEARIPAQAIAALTAPAAPAAAGAAVDAASAGLGVPSLTQLRALQHLTTGMIGGAGADAVKSINRTLGQVVLGALPPFDAVKAVGQVLPAKTKSQVQAIVRSQLATTFNSAGYAQLAATAARDPAVKKMWRRSGKVHSRANHDAADGQVQDVGTPFTLAAGDGRGEAVDIMYPGSPAAPIGETINCGCIAIAWKSTWKMLNSGAKPFTPAELAAKAAAASRGRGRTVARKPAAGASAKVGESATRQRIGQAFAASGGTWRDVTGQQLVVNDKLFPPTIGDARLTTPGRDLYSYWATQTLKRPTEVWETDSVTLATGEVVKTRQFIKRFTAGGQTWVSSAQFKLVGSAWQPTGAYKAVPAGQRADQVQAGLRAGMRVWPKK